MNDYKFQVMPNLSADEYAELREDIKQRGVMVPIEFDENGVILDGHHRLQICEELGIKEYPRVIRAGMTDEEKRTHARKLNMARRHLTQEQKRGLICEQLKETPEKSDRQIAKDLGVSNRTVSLQRKDMVQKNELCNLHSSIGADGKERPRKVEHKPVSVFNPTTREVKSLQNPEVVERIAETNAKPLTAVKQMQLEKAKQHIAEQNKPANKPVIHIGDSVGYIPAEKYDLLLTDPPYSTDVENINVFVEKWLYTALDNIKDTGFAYIFIGAYPEEIKAYFNAKIPNHIKLCQPLIWTYKNTLGNNPKDRYKLNYQLCLFYRGTNAPALDCPLTAEQWAVQEINAPDGRQGDRYHAWQKPLEIAERFIRHSTKQGQTVFDPFACTGTFLIAAAKLGRKAYGFEINADNAKIAEERGCTLV